MHQRVGFKWDLISNENLHPRVTQSQPGKGSYYLAEEAQGNKSPQPSPVFTQIINLRCKLGVEDHLLDAQTTSGRFRPGGFICISM